MSTTTGESKISPVPAVPSFATPPPPPPAAMTARTGGGASPATESLAAKVGRLLGSALDDATSLEVTTYTSSGADSATGQQEQLTKNMRLRATTKVKLDGDTQVCVPVLDNGQPDEALWKIHNEVVQQARADRKATLEMAIHLLQKLSPGGK